MNYSGWLSSVQVEICLEYPVVLWLHCLIYGGQRGVVWRSCSRLGRSRDRLLVENLILTFGPMRHIDVNASHELVVQSLETDKVSNITHINLEVNTVQEVVRLINILFLVWCKTLCFQYFDIIRMYLQYGLMKVIGHIWQVTFLASFTGQTAEYHNIITWAVVIKIINVITEVHLLLW